jgi:hypothetical protein
LVIAGGGVLNIAFALLSHIKKAPLMLTPGPASVWANAVAVWLPSKVNWAWARIPKKIAQTTKTIFFIIFGITNLVISLYKCGIFVNIYGQFPEK